jgi:hypothetical protein
MNQDNYQSYLLFILLAIVVLGLSEVLGDNPTTNEYNNRGDKYDNHDYSSFNDKIPNDLVLFTNF